MNYLLFDDFRQWLTCLLAGVRKFCWGIFRIVTCLIGAVLSLLRALWRRMVRFTGNYPNIVLGAAIVVVALVWVLTFASMRAKVVGAEHQRDSLSYELSKFTQMYDKAEEKVIVEDDTISYQIWQQK